MSKVARNGKDQQLQRAMALVNIAADHLKLSAPKSQGGQVYLKDAYQLHALAKNPGSVSKHRVNAFENVEISSGFAAALSRVAQRIEYAFPLGKKNDAMIGDDTVETLQTIIRDIASHPESSLPLNARFGLVADVPATPVAEAVSECPSTLFGDHPHAAPHLTLIKGDGRGTKPAPARLVEPKELAFA